MAKKPIDYQKAVLYKVFNRCSQHIYYIGYTTNFTEKKKIIRKKIKYSTDAVYFMIRDCPSELLGIEVIKKVPSDDKFYLDNMISDLNFRIKRNPTLVID
jgi:hypothetical protein